MTPRLKSILLLLGVFSLGGVTGGAVVRAVALRHMNALFDGSSLVLRQRAFVSSLKREIDLDDRQMAEVQRILAEHAPELHEIRRTIGPRTARIRATMMDEMRKVMRPDQLPQFQRFAEKQERHARRDGEIADLDGGALAAP